MKTERFELKLSPEDKALLSKAAHIQGKSIGSFVLDCAVARARKVANPSPRLSV